jgi:transposase-like protein
MRKQYTAEQREKLIAEVRATGEGVGVVAKRLGVTSSSAYLWMKAATESAPAGAPIFARVVSSRPQPMRLEVGGAAVLIESGFDAELLRQVVAALSTAP